MKTDAFFTLHRDLPREGPGTAADVLWALDVAGVAGAADIADLACGPGADTTTLAEARPDARIFALDKTEHFVRAARARTQGLGPRVTVVQGDMLGPLPGPFDFIWCAGALYFAGIERALAAWTPALRSGGRVAFSEPVWVTDPPCATARAFWAGYPGVGHPADIDARVRRAGFRTIDTRIVAGAAWAEYYAPQEERIGKLRAAGADAGVEEVLREAEQEIALWRESPGDIAYLLSVVAAR